MVENLHNFSGLLQTQTEIIESLLMLSKEKQQVLLSGDVNKLAELVQQEENLIVTIGKLENSRFENFKELATVMGLPETTSLEEIAAKFPEEARGKLVNFKQTMAGLVKELQETNEQNTSLINQSLDLIRFSIESMVDSHEGPSYNNPEREQRQSVSFLVDKRI